MKQAMALPGSPLESIDESQIRQAAAPFFEEGRDPGPLAVLLVAAYWQRGADLTRAINLWFLLMSYSDDPVKWFQPLWLGKRGVERNYHRRSALVEGAIGHLYGGLRLRRLPVALPERACRVFSRPNMGAYAETSLTPHRSVEILSANRGYYLVRTHDNFRGYVPVGSLDRQKLLPHDE
jgi:hypothetical protein